ncbi:hypothetical protein ROG8370_03981 [Roseovarius gaetbuli]|uniref:Uncharacterized protein n=1 Tax=Roseovarius gaetbuli TaxID=1356575 RepID=A0A1X7ADG9_9RHOB|nr:hypothetical protein ROG8370_03981 [Roseovarius gaetbuli]
MPILQRDGAMTIVAHNDDDFLFMNPEIAAGIAAGDGSVIPPFLMGSNRRNHAAVFSFIAGVMPPMPMLGRSLL